VQAGASEAGLDLAAATAEAVFTSHPMLESAQQFYQDLKARVVAKGRSADSLKILTAIQPIVASSEVEANAIADELTALIHEDVAISLLQMSLGGFDFSGYDLDGPLPDLPPSKASQGTQKRIVDLARKENLSIIQVARQVAAGRTSKMVNGTAVQIADTLEQWFKAGAADGFVIAAPILPDMLARFVDEVVPILQERGLFRQDYAGTTLREHLGLERPVSRYALDPELHQEPEIWKNIF